MSVTIHEIAKAAGVSIATVSRVLNHSEHPVSGKTSQRVWDVADALGYLPNQLARSLRTEHTATVGIITDDITSEFSPLIVRAIQDYLSERHYSTLIINADREPEVEEAAIRSLLSRSVDGIIFVETWHREANQQLDRAAKPYVFAHRQFAKAYRNSVRPDERVGPKLAMDHLLSLGHRRVAYINGPPNFFASAERLQGYQEALARSNVDFDPTLVASGDWKVDSGYAAMKEILRAQLLPTAVFAANDFMALGAIYAIHDHGLRVPDDIAIVGYDDRDVASLVRPSLTTVTMPCAEMGRASADMLLQLINNPFAEVEERRISGKLIVRQSCGAK
ncbi:MAG: LacI family DNA-binding transcriptional regulator [Caldilineaceae bacterium]